MLKVLIFAINMLVFFQGASSKDDKYELDELKGRGIKDVWNNIKTSAKNIWIAVKTIAQNTKDRIKVWTSNFNKKANQIRVNFENSLKNIKEKAKIIMEQIVGTGQIVKQCMQKENEVIEGILKGIIKRMTSCMSEAISLSRLEENQFNIELNDKKFIEDVENKFNKCVNTYDEENIVDCLLTVRKEIFENMVELEDNILANRTETRGIVDDLLDTLMMCSIEGLLEASGAIAAETVTIVACAIKG